MYQEKLLHPWPFNEQERQVRSQIQRDSQGSPSGDQPPAEGPVTAMVGSW
jgi:hypothetical protein